MSRLWEGWSRWAFAPVDTAPMAALRVLVGVLTVGWTLSLLPDAQVFLGADGVQRTLPVAAGGAWVVPLGPPYLALGVLLVAAVALALGWRTRVASVVGAVLLLAVVGTLMAVPTGAEVAAAAALLAAGAGRGAAVALLLS
ncbi:MAG: hypothetical protein JWR42_295, partial [Marmoricola sp.]|nr:hypothetical protein [Marmoricola sp.]